MFEILARIELRIKYETMGTRKSEREHNDMGKALTNKCFYFSTEPLKGGFLLCAQDTKGRKQFQNKGFKMHFT